MAAIVSEAENTNAAEDAGYDEGLPAAMIAWTG